jgi:hypothetical protein
MAENEADALMRLISTGQLQPQAPGATVGPPTRDELARLLMDQWGRQALPTRAGIAAAGYQGGE